MQPLLFYCICIVVIRMFFQWGPLGCLDDLVRFLCKHQEFVHVLHCFMGVHLLPMVSYVRVPKDPLCFPTWCLIILHGFYNVLYDFIFAFRKKKRNFKRFDVISLGQPPGISHGFVLNMSSCVVSNAFVFFRGLLVYLV